MSRVNAVGLAETGFPNHTVTRSGEVYSAAVGGQLRKLRPWRHQTSGRYMVTLMREGRRRTFTLARLVLGAFGRPSPGGRGYVPAHRNGDPSDHRDENLEWRKKADPGRERALKMVRGLVRRYDLRPDEVFRPKLK
jgi:hypothetical protein